jgi:hypothetical protein
MVVRHQRLLQRIMLLLDLRRNVLSQVEFNVQIQQTLTNILILLIEQLDLECFQRLTL